MGLTKNIAAFATAALVGIGGALAVAGTGSDERVMEFDSVTFDNLEDTGAASDLVVEGTIGRRVATEIDHGGDANAVGVPMVFHEVVVHAASDENAEKTIVVGFIDPADVLTESVAGVATGDRVVLFLEYIAVGTAPGVTKVESFYVPLGLDSGVVDVTASGRAHPRDLDVNGFGTQGFEPGTTVDEVLAELGVTHKPKG